MKMVTLTSVIAGFSRSSQDVLVVKNLSTSCSITHDDARSTFSHHDRRGFSSG